MDANGCTFDVPVTITEPAALGGSITAQTNVLCNGDATGAVTVAGANGTAGYTYSLDGGTTTQISGTFNNLTAGAITVTVVDANGCTFDVPVTITEPAALGGSITAQTNVLCNADATGAVTVAGANGTAGYTYSLDGGTTTQASGTFNNLTAGAITVTVVDANGCTFDVPVTITEPAALGGSITAQTNVLCNADATGAVTVAGANGTAGYTYSLDGGTTTQASGTFNNLTAGAITVTVVDANGCSFDVPVTITEPAALGGSITAQTNVLCNADATGAVTVAGANGTAGYTYSLDGGTTTQISGTFNNLTAGAITVTVVDANGCTFDVPVTITEPAALGGSITAQTNVLCNADATGTVTVAGANGTAGYTYSLDGGTTTQASGTFNNLTAGAITVTVVDANGCTFDVPVTITEPAALGGSITAQTNVLCNADATGAVTVAGANGTAGYTYSLDGGTTTQVSGTFNNLTAGAITVTVVDANGCSFDVPVTITEPTALGGSITAQTNVLCNADATGAVTVAGANGTAGYTYSLDGGTTTQISGTFNNLTAGAITVTVVDANGCTFDVPVTITEPAALGGSITAQTNVLCNADATGAVTVAGANGTAGYTYSLDGGTTTQISGTFNNLTAGAITVTVVDANGCTFDVPVTITEPNVLISSLVSTTDATCGSSNGDATVSASGGSGGIEFSIDGGTTFQANGTFSNLAPGTYTIIIEDDNGCQNQITATINDLSGINASITAQTNVLCNGDATGAVTVTASGSIAPYTYSDDGINFTTNNNFNGLNSGNYTITASDANGCEFPVNVTITEPAALGGSITAQTNVLCNGDATGAVTVAGANGTAGYTYSLDGGTTTQASGTFNNLTAGAITVTVVDANGCSFDVPVTITEPAALGGSITAQTNVLCNADATGAVTVAGANGTAGYTYSLDGGTTTQISGTFNNLTAGAITVTVVDANGCTFDVPVTITEPAALGGSITAQTNVLCNADATGTVTVAGANGTAGYTYSLDGGTTTQASGTFNNLTAGAITVTVVDANGCTFDVPVTITEPAALGGSITAQTNVLCNADATGAVTVAGANGTAGYTYSLDGGTTTQVSGTFNNLTAGAITVTVVDANGCSFDVPVTITEPTALGGSITAQTNVLCNGDATGAVTVAGANGTAGYTYSLDGGTTTQASGTFNNLTAGAITVTVVDANGCTFDVPVTITEPAALGGSITAQTNVLCNADATGAVTVAGANGTAGYTYSLDGGTTTQISGTFNNLTAGAITVTVVDANGCTFDVPVTITEPNVLISSLVSTTDATCGSSNGDATVSASGGSGGIEFSIDGGTTFQANGTFSNLAPGTYTIIIEDDNGCQNQITATINDLSGINASITAQTNVLCNGDATGAVTVTASGSIAPYTYSDDGINFTTNNNFNGLNSGNYTITASDANGCEFPVNVTITEPAALGGSITAQTNVLCNGDATGAVTVAGANGTAGYTYSLDGGTTTQASGTFNNLTAGAITVTVVDANGCSFDVPVTITEPAALGGSITAQTNVLCNADATGAVTVAGANGTAGYTYSLDGGTTTQISGTFNNLTAGAITVTVVDANGCTFDVPVTITEPAALGGSITAQTNVLCNGDATGTVTVAGANGTAGYTYSLDGGTTTQASGTFNNLTAGAITVTVVDANGCTFDVPVTITEPAALGGSITAQTNVLCNADATGAVTVAGANGTAGYTYSLDGGTTTQVSGTFNNLTAGAITVTVVDANGCTFDVPVTITEPAALGGSITAQTNVLCNADATGAVTVAGANGTAGYTYSLDGGTTTQASGTFNNLTAGAITVTVVDANGCTFDVPVTITEPAALGGSITAQTNVLCNADATGAVTVAGANGTAGYTYSLDGGTTTQISGTFNNLTAGAITVTVVDANGCTFDVPVTITEPNVLTSSLVSTTDATCGLANGDFEVTGLNGTAPYQYSNDNGVTFQPSGTLSGLTAGSYNILIQDDNGCQTTITVNVADLSGLTAVIDSQSDADCFGNSTGIVSVTGSGSTAPYTYDIGNGPQPTGSFNGLAAGSYTVTVTDDNGCIFPVAVTVNEPAALTATATGTNPLCNGSADGSADVTITWRNSSLFNCLATWPNSRRSNWGLRCRNLHTRHY